MLIRTRIQWALAWGVVFGLSIGLPLGWGVSRSSYSPFDAPHIESSNEGAKGGTTYVVQEPEGWGAPLVIMTAVLCGITGWLAWWTRGLFRETRILARDSRDASAKALAASTEATKLATREFVSTHRPRLRVRKLTLHPTFDEAPIKAQYEVANVGGTDATLVWADLTVEIPKDETHGFGESPADDPPFYGADRFMETRTIPPGGHLIISFDTDLLWRENEARFQPSNMIFRGVVHYRDSNGVERHTAFERFHVPASRQYGRGEKPDPDYEYED